MQINEERTKAVCAVCNEEKDLSEGIILTIPLEGHPGHETARQENMAKYGEGTPFICNGCRPK